MALSIRASIAVGFAVLAGCGSSGSKSDAGPTGGGAAGSAATGSAGSGGGSAGSAGNAAMGFAGRGGGGMTGSGGGGSWGVTGSAGGGGTGVTSRFSCVVAAPGPLAPTYFVDFASGSDAANGRSQATAWKHAPGDPNAAASAAAVALAPGDVVVFKGGVHYLGAIAIPASGKSAAPIIYDGNSRGDWGTGLAIVDGEKTRASGFSLTGKSFVVIDSFAIQSFSKAMSSTAVAIDGGSNDEVRNCRVSDVYYATNPNPGSKAWEKQAGNGISVNNSPGTRISHNFVRDVGNAGISWGAESGMQIMGGEISCNEVTNMNWGIAVALGNSKPGTKIDGVKVLGNYIHDFDQYNVASVWHRDGLFVFARPDTDQASVENLEIAYNYFEDHKSPDFGSTAWIYIEYVCRGFKIHHNILNASRSYFAIRVLGDGFQVAGNHVFADNVIANANGMGIGMHLQESSGISLHGNIFYDDNEAYMVHKTSMAGFSADYDLLYRTDGQKQLVILNAGPAEMPNGDGYAFADLGAKTTDEAHGQTGDPMFTVAPASITGDPSGFLPRASSPAIDHGVSDGDAQDFAGNPIPTGAAPDIGAFERQP
jgi:hypothetical protein